MFSPARLVLSLIKLRWSRELWSQTRTRATCYTSQQNSYQCDEYLHCTAPNMMSVKSRGSSSDSDVDRSCIQSSTEPGMRITIVRFPCPSWRTHQSIDTPWLTEEIYLDFALCNLWRAYSHPNCRPNRSEVPSSTCWSSHGHATHPMSTNESTHTSLSHSTNVVELDSEVFDSEVLRLPTTSLRLGYHKFGSSWLGSAGCQSPDRIRLCPSWLSFYEFSVSSRSTHTAHQLRRFWNPRGKLGSYGPFSCEALSSTKRHCEVAMRKSVLRILQQDQDRRCGKLAAEFMLSRNLRMPVYRSCIVTAVEYFPV